MNKVYFSSTKALENEQIFWHFYKNSKRQAKIDKLVNIADKRLCLLSGILLDFGLKECGILDYNLIYNDFGKPYLADNSVFFSISHSGDYALCAISSKEVGCDIEIIKDNNIDIAKEFFNKLEFQKIQNSKNPKLEFYNLWCQKESYLKALGIGLNDGLDFTLNDEIFIKNQKYYIQDLNIDKAYKSVLCSAFKKCELIKLKF